MRRLKKRDAGLFWSLPPALYVLYFNFNKNKLKFFVLWYKTGQGVTVHEADEHLWTNLGDYKYKAYRMGQ